MFAENHYAQPFKVIYFIQQGHNIYENTFVPLQNILLKILS